MCPSATAQKYLLLPKGHPLAPRHERSDSGAGVLTFRVSLGPTRGRSRSAALGWGSLPPDQSLRPLGLGSPVHRLDSDPQLVDWRKATSSFELLALGSVGVAL